MRRRIAVAAGICAVLISLSGSVFATEDTQPATEATTAAVTTEAPVEVTTAPTEAKEETQATKLESKTYRVIVDQAQTYANVDGTYLALADTIAKDVQIQGYAPVDGYMKTTDGVYLKVTDVEEVTLPSITPAKEQVLEPLPEKKDMTGTWLMLIAIFLCCLFFTGLLGYYIRGVVEKKKWENDPFRYDKPADDEGKPTNESENSKDTAGKKRTVLDNMLDKMKSKKNSSTEPVSKVNRRWIKGGVDDQGRTFYYEPEDIDPEGEPFYLDSQGKKVFYQ